jgi:hypothetical protein
MQTLNGEVDEVDPEAGIYRLDFLSIQAVARPGCA